MDVTKLLEPVLTPGIRNTHFFNGRVLTAEDLRTEQTANREQRRQLARALGEGVVHGLDVTTIAAVSGAPAVRIMPGLAFNRDGDPVALGRTIDLLLVPREAIVPPEAGLFAVCLAPDAPLELSNVGLYVLTVRPASALSEERAPMTDFGSEGIAASCASRWALEGVRFSVAPLPLATPGATPSALAAELGELAQDIEENVELVMRGGASATETVIAELRAQLSRFRNGAAYFCFGVEQLAVQLTTPFSLTPGFPDAAYGAIDAMRERAELSSCDVPVALLFLSRRGIEWVDEWAVRRSPVPSATAGMLVALPRARAFAEASAQVLQFEQHIRELRESSIPLTALAAIEANEYFRFLPPFGLVPILGFGASRGFGLTTFFNELRTGDPVPVAESSLRTLASAALLQPPIDLADEDALQLFRAGAPGESSRPSWVAFTRRGLRAAPEPDAVARTLNDATNAYRALLRRRILLPATESVDSTGARVSIMALLADVIGTARQLSGAATAGLVDRADALRAFDRMHDIQHELTALLLGLDSAINGAAVRQEFGNSVDDLLDIALPGGARALGPAVADGSVAAAIVAQDAINNYVAGWTGESIAIGTIRLQPLPGSDGPVLVPDSEEPFDYLFELRNSTDETISIRVNAIIGAHEEDADGELEGDWAGAISITPAGFATTEGVALGSNTTRTITVTISPPAGAQVGDIAALEIMAEALPPNTQTAAHVLRLEVGEERAEEVTRIVEITNFGQPSSLQRTRAEPGVVLSYFFDMRYTADTEPLTAPFMFEVVPETALGEFLVQIPGAAPGALTIERQLIAGAAPESHRTAFTITTGATRGRSLDFHVRVSSPTLGIEDESITLNITMAP